MQAHVLWGNPGDVYVPAVAAGPGISRGLPVFLDVRVVRAPAPPSHDARLIPFVDNVVQDAGPGPAAVSPTARRPTPCSS